jgi:hypothetical protein
MLAFDRAGAFTRYDRDVGTTIRDLPPPRRQKEPALQGNFPEKLPAEKFPKRHGGYGVLAGRSLIY